MLKCLHSSRGHIVLHRDIKSSNVLLDTYWNTKISNFGLSSIIPVSKEFSFHVSSPVGTSGYFDPHDAETGVLTKQVDVYSFGVVLFKVLCGRLCTRNYKDDYPLLSKLAQSYWNEEKRIHTILLDCLQHQISPSSLSKFLSIAYKCLEITINVL
ncbi:putative protein kinase RLK-Pelle-CrRLK1L-1 family [Helianthus annuus]|nr:putative protein kinase RLK-Pelle-CrRLK1L-1 family [Helianthus annuus]KAJ0723219.1 putative protein kinase RLK-Pelle-CrRLK1L-1 family [Helianthus annuus]